MKSGFSKIKVFSLLALFLTGFIACGVGGGGGDNTGRLSLSLTDKPARHDFGAVYVTIGDIYAHRADDPEDSWTKILTVDKIFNLKTLGGGVRVQLGMVTLDPGHYTQMRLMISTAKTDGHPYANYVLINGDPTPHELKIPSGFQTGVKLVQGFDINESSTTELIFDFDAEQSVVVAGNSDNYILKPTIHAIDDSRTFTIIKGTVKDKDGNGLDQAGVDLQVYHSGATDPKNEIEVPWSTLTDTMGNYMFWFIDVPTATTLNVVATDWALIDGTVKYAPAWDQVKDAVNGNAYERNFVLNSPAEVGVLNLKIRVEDSDAVDTPNQQSFVTVSIRQLSDLEGAPMVQVVKKPTVGYDDDKPVGSITPIEFKLPVLPAAGEYTVVVWTDESGWVTQKITGVKVSTAGPTELDIVLKKVTP